MELFVTCAFIYNLCRFIIKWFIIIVVFIFIASMAKMDRFTFGYGPVVRYKLKQLTNGYDLTHKKVKSRDL